ncbi:MAG: hypothetical protein MUQ56_01210 [Thermoleophilia bacterium]|nr:hypothetical protein [Thermoleophilia bacterium]
MRAMVEEIRARGGTIKRELKAMNAGAAVIAFVPRSAEPRPSFCPQPA